MYHFGLKIGDTDEELRAALADLTAAGVKVVGSADHTVTHSLYLEDPDGNEIELYVDVDTVDWRTDPSLVLAPTKPLAHLRGERRRDARSDHQGPDRTPERRCRGHDRQQLDRDHEPPAHRRRSRRSDGGTPAASPAS